MEGAGLCPPASRIRCASATSGTSGACAVGAEPDDVHHVASAHRCHQVLAAEVSGDARARYFFC
jgi:hypothetical protein